MIKVSKEVVVIGCLLLVALLVGLYFYLESVHKDRILAEKKIALAQNQEVQLDSALSWSRKLVNINTQLITMIRSDSLTIKQYEQQLSTVKAAYDKRSAAGQVITPAEAEHIKQVLAYSVGIGKVQVSGNLTPSKSNGK